MKEKFRIIMSVVLALSCTCLISKERSVIASAKKITYGSNRFLIRDAVILLPEKTSDESKFAIQQLQLFVKEQTGIELPMVKSSKQKQNKVIRFLAAEDIASLPVPHEAAGPDSREALHITVKLNEVNIITNSSAGLYYAAQTLRQLIHKDGTNSYLQEMELDDYPGLPYRAVMMDISHGGLLAVEEIKRHIEFLARFKINQYCLYSEVSIELEGYAALNYKASYTKDEIRSIIEFARQRHIDIVPYFNLYGHLHELLRNEQYKSLGIGNYGHEVDPRNPKVNALLKNWIKQYSSLFQSPFVHIGFDETWETKRISADSLLKINGEQLYVDQINFVNEEFKKYGKTVMAWTDMTNFYPEIISKFPKDVIPVIWEYSPDPRAVNRFLAPVLKYGSTFMIQSAVSGWGQIYPSSSYTFGNIDNCLKEGLANKSTGYITSLWTDAVEPFLRPSWMFTGYGSIIAWQGKTIDKQDFINDFVDIIFPHNSKDMKMVFSKLDSSEIYLEKCLGRSQTGSIVESWSNPFSTYYLENTRVHQDDFSKSRILSEEAQDLLINVLRKSPEDSIYKSSLLVSAQLMHYTASRFIYARAIVDRWNEAVLVKKNTEYLFYDIAYTCHGMLVDAMDNNGELKSAYAKQWLNEFMPYRLNTMLSRFDVEAGLWRKLYLKFLDFDVQNKGNKSGNAPKSFEELFKPDF
jgi:hypothetical protein